MLKLNNVFMLNALSLHTHAKTLSLTLVGLDFKSNHKAMKFVATPTLST